MIQMNTLVGPLTNKEKITFPTIINVKVNNDDNEKSTGLITQIIGPVLDVDFSKGYINIWQDRS